jgi:hypothetical protein
MTAASTVPSSTPSVPPSTTSHEAGQARRQARERAKSAAATMASPSLAAASIADPSPRTSWVAERTKTGAEVARHISDFAYCCKEHNLCSFCYLRWLAAGAPAGRDDGLVRHDTLSCPAFLELNPDKDQYFRLSEVRSEMKIAKYTCCWKCYWLQDRSFFPLCNANRRPSNNGGREQCNMRYNDIIHPVGIMVFWDDHMRKSVLGRGCTEFGIPGPLLNMTPMPDHDTYIGRWLGSEHRLFNWNKGTNMFAVFTTAVLRHAVIENPFGYIPVLGEEKRRLWLPSSLANAGFKDGAATRQDT